MKERMNRVSRTLYDSYTMSHVGKNPDCRGYCNVSSIARWNIFERLSQSEEIFIIGPTCIGLNLMVSDRSRIQPRLRAI